MIVAVSGKGGTGKTLVASLIIRNLLDKDLDILAIDADPDSNLPEALGAKAEKTVGDVREELKRETGKGEIPYEMGKWDVLEYKIMEAVVETSKFDMLVMGRPEGSGCYCAVNNMLRKIIETLSNNYDVIVVDTEAGLEHLSRRTTQNVDIMLIVTDTSKRGILTAQRIKELSDELDIKFKEMYFILNRANPKKKEELLRKIEDTGLNIIGTINEDENVTEYDIEGKPLIELPENSSSVLNVSEIVNKILYKKEIR
ncbi:MAG: ATP-binding protein [Euryarchaeota archaeon]|nr:ATP-binding protein [Euryarchaeota archaeon]